MMNNPANGTPAADQYAQEEQPGGFCIKIYVGADGQVQSVAADTESAEAPQEGGQPVSMDQALQQVRQLIERGPDTAAPPPGRTPDEQAMDGYRGTSRRNVVGVNDVFSRD